jgi:hypothetical protein
MSVGTNEQGAPSRDRADHRQLPGACVHGVDEPNPIRPRRDVHSVDGVNLGGWYDYSAYENGDKCAWVGYLEGVVPSSTVPDLPVTG